jgi:hypothetical protein
MKYLSYLLGDIKILTNFVIICLFILMFIYFVILLFKDEDFFIEKCLKIGGALLIALISLFSNSEFVYIVSIFIIATFITKLDFLENFAAIIWNRAFVFEYRKASLIPQSKAEIKINTEKNLLVSNKLISDESSRVNKESLIKFEDSAIKKLLSFDFIGKIQRNLKLRLGSGATYYFDAIISSSNFEYIIEVKYLLSNDSIIKTIQKLTNNINILDNYYKNNRINKFISAILIIPSTSNFTDTDEDIFVLKYNEQNDTFENEGDFTDWYLDNLFI